MNKGTVMRAANLIIEALLFASDGEFVDDVVSHVVDGVTFGEDEIRAVEEDYV